MKGSSGKTSPLVAKYLEAMPAELAALEKDAGRLDRSYASLDKVEDYLLGVATGKISGDKKIARGRAARYAGTVLVDRTGGMWSTKARDAETICVSGFPGYAKQECEPGDIAGRVAKHPALSVGALRDEIEICDIALRKQQLAALVRDPDARVRELRDDITAATGKEPKLDFSPASVDAIEAAIQKAMSGRAAREQQRRMKNAAVIYLGTMAVKRLGKGEWTVKDKPGVVGFGHFRIHNWQPASNVELVMPESEPGALREAVEHILKGGE